MYEKEKKSEMKIGASFDFEAGKKGAGYEVDASYKCL